MKRTLLFLTPFILCQCSSMERSIGLGAGIGAAGGVAAGYAANLNMKGMALTTTTGALTGALTGYLIHKWSEKEPTAPPPPGIPPQNPLLKDAQTESIWIPDRIEDSRFIQGHWIYEIRSPSTWALSDSEKEGKENGNKREEKENRSQNSTKRKHDKDPERLEE